MITHEDQVRALLSEAARMPTSAGKFEVIAEAERIADTHNDVALGFEARMALMAVAGNLLRGDAMAVAFTWCLHHYDRRPDLFAGRNLFWEYRTLIGRLANFDTVSREQLLDMIDDFAVRLAREGHPPGLALNARVALGPDLGDRRMATDAYAELQRLRLSAALTPAEQFQHHLFVGDEDSALRLAEQFVLASGRNHFDMHWYDLIGLLMWRDRWADAARWLSRAVSQVVVRDCYYWPFGKVVIGLTLIGRIDDAVKLCGQCQRAIREYTDPLTRLHFCLDMGVLFDRLHAVGRASVLIRFADGPPGLRPNGHYEIAAVRAWLADQATELAERFDRRNGTRYFAELIRERAALQHLARPVQ